MCYRILATLSILITLVLPTPTSAAIPIARNTTLANPQPSLSIFQNISYTGPTYKCTKPGLFRTDKRPSWAECYRAIRALPQTHDTNTFHTRGYNNGYRLPMTESFGRCRAHVELAGRAFAVSSWADVVAGLDHLSILCRRMTFQEERVAGWMVMGPEEKIKVSLLGPNDPIPPGVEKVGDESFLNGTREVLSERRVGRKL